MTGTIDGAEGTSSASVTKTTHEDAPGATKRPTMVLAVVFVGGLVSIGIELSASRLLAPFFGTSTFIWANLIGLTLAYLAIGYWIGGRVADRWPRTDYLYLVTMVAAVAVGIIPFVARPILDASLAAFDEVAVGAFYGSLLGVILLFAIPVTLLGFVTPYAIRLTAAGATSAGTTSGRIYALSTVGSIAGSFLPVLVLVPLFGTRATFVMLSCMLLIMSSLGLMLERRPGQAVLSILAAAGLVAVQASGASAGIKPPDMGTLLYETESQYNYIQVLDVDGRTLLALNEGHAIHSIYDPEHLLTGGPWDYFMIPPLFLDTFDPADIDHALLIGLAGGTGARSMLAAYPDLTVDGVEIDPEIVRVGREYFHLDDPRLNVITEDGRYFLNRSSGSWDIIAIDAYHQPYIPFQFTTTEFFTSVQDHLEPGGSVVVNVGRTATDYRLVDALATTMLAVFDHVYIVDTGRFLNSMVIGTDDPSSVEAFATNVQALPPGSVLRQVGDESLQSGAPRIAVASGEPFTDNHAPVERVIDQIILDEAIRESEGP